MCSLFCGHDGSDTYKRLREAHTPSARAARAFVEHLWACYEPYAEPDYADRFRRETHQYFWEMHLACALLDVGLTLGRKDEQETPDVQVVAEGRPHWFEATVATPGDPRTQDAEPPLRWVDDGNGLGRLEESPEEAARGEEKLILRLRARIFEKAEDPPEAEVRPRDRCQYTRHRDTGAIDGDSPYVVAINGGQLHRSFRRGHPPHIVQAMLPIAGPEQQCVDRRTGQFLYAYWQYRNELVKEGRGGRVATDLFSTRRLPHLSAVLYCPHDCYNATQRAGVGQLGDDFILVHNPNADNHLPQGLIPRGTEYVPGSEPNTIRTIHHSGLRL